MTYIDERCDYCGAALIDERGYLRGYMRIVGYTTLGANQKIPECKLHCGNCIPPDEIDPKAALDWWLRLSQNSEAT